MELIDLACSVSDKFVRYAAVAKCYKLISFDKKKVYHAKDPHSRANWKSLVLGQLECGI